MNQILRTLKSLFRLGRLGSLNDNTKTQEAQIELFDNEVVSEVERFQDYGFTSKPVSGGVVAAQVSGNRNHMIVLRINDDEHRIKLNDDWDVALYHKEGHSIQLQQDGLITLTCSKYKVVAGKMEVDAEETTFHGDVIIKGQSESADHICDGVSFNSHVHSGVEPGNSNTGIPQ